MVKKHLGPTIKIRDSVYSFANAEAKKIIIGMLQYKYKYFQRSLFGKGKTEIRKGYLISGRRNTGGELLTGLIPRIKKSFEEKINFIGKIEKIKPDSHKPYLKGIEFRKDQLVAIRRMKIFQRGLVIYPTGSGKTIICFGFLSMFLSKKILFLCHTIDLINQASEELKKFGIEHDILGGGRKINEETYFEKKQCFLLATIQSMSKLNVAKKQFDFFDITIVDEVHNAANANINYHRFMTSNLSPIRIGLTATIPKDKQKALIAEGLFGPVIAELTEQQGNEIGVIAKTKVNLVPIPFPDSLINERVYQKIYELGIVHNKIRNLTIIGLSLDTIKLNKQVLIIVERVEHGRILRKLFERKRIDCPFVQGNENAEFRTKIKTMLRRKTLNVAIATKVWKEGINIPTLDHIIFASGGKDEKSIRQAMGRGLRIAKGKEEIILTDFMDNGRYLAEHSVARFTVYKNLGWI